MSRRKSTLQDPNLVGTRDIDSKYDNIKLVADNLDTINEVADNFSASLKYLGASATPPSARLDGSPIEDGDYFFNTLNGIKRITYYSAGDDSWFSVDPSTILQHAQNAEASMNVAVTSAGAAASSASTASNSEAVAVQAAIDAKSYRDSAGLLSASAYASSDSATASANSALDSKNSAELASQTAVAAKDQTVLDAAATASDRVQTGNDKTASAASASAAASSETSASDSATSATASADSANTSASSASDSASAASDSETASGASATAAAGSASTATTKAGEASTSASEALTSKNSASSSKDAAETAAATATIAKDEATTQADASESSATAAAQSAADALAAADSTSAKNLATKKAEFFALAMQLDQQNAGNGFLEMGKHSNISGHESINQGLAAVTAGYEKLLLGRSDTFKVGESRSDHPVCLVGGAVVYVNNGLDVQQISFPDAPDGLDKKDGTGRFSDIAAAVVAGTTNLSESVISRKDFIMLEVWHEKISEVVFPYGNVQYAASTFEGIALGTDHVSQGYYAFGEWDTTTKGYGNHWPSLSQEDKLKYVQNSDNNIYLDGDELIQVRYRIRVIKGLSDSSNVSLNDAFISVSASSDTSIIRVRGEDTSSSDDARRPASSSKRAVYGGSVFNDNPSLNPLVLHDAGKGSYKAIKFSTSDSYNNYYGHNGLCSAIPIALVQRRNKGAGHPLNPNGCAITRTSGGVWVQWYQASDQAPASVSDCFRQMPYIPDSGYIAGGAGGSGRWNSDGKYYDAIYTSDVQDLRANANKIDDAKVLFKETNKAIAGEVRGFEAVPFTAVDNEKGTTTTNQVFTTTVNSTSNYSVGDKVHIEVAAGIFEEHKVSAIINSTQFTTLMSHNRLNNGSVVHESLRSRHSSETPTWTDILGTPAKIAAMASALGVDGFYGTWIGVPDSSGSYALSRKSGSASAQALYTENSGGTYFSYSQPINTTTNSITSTTGSSNNVYIIHYPTKARFTEGSTKLPATTVGNVYATSARDVVDGNLLISSLISKIGTAGDIAKETLLTYRTIRNGKFVNDGFTWKQEHPPIEVLGTGVAIKVLFSLAEAEGFKVVQMHYKEMVHDAASINPILLVSGTPTSLVKGQLYRLPTDLEDKLFAGLYVVAKRDLASITPSIYWFSGWYTVQGRVDIFNTSHSVDGNFQLFDGNGWGDDNRFQIADNQSTLPDENGNTVKYGTAVFKTNVLAD